MLNGFLIWATGAVATAICFAAFIASAKHEDLASPSAITLYVAWPVAWLVLGLAIIVISVRKIVFRLRPYRASRAKDSHPEQRL